MREEFNRIEKQLNQYLNTDYDPIREKNLAKDYIQWSSTFNKYKNESIAVLRQIFMLISTVMPSYLTKMTPSVVFDSFVAPFKRNKLLKSHYESINANIAEPNDEYTPPPGTNVSKTDFSKVLDFFDSYKILSEYHKKVALFVFGLLLFCADVWFMASQYVDVFNSPSGGTILAIVLIVVTAILSGAAGAYYYAEHKRLISSTLLSVAILLDVLSVIIRLFAKYDAEIDEIIYFPDTADAESILMACIIFGLTLFGIFLTYSESKKVFNSAYKQYRIALERNAVLTEALPRFASLLQDLEEYMDKHNVEYQRED